MYAAYVNNTGVVITGLIGIFRALLNEINVSIGTYLMFINAQHFSVVAGADCGWPSWYEQWDSELRCLFFRLNSGVVNVLINPAEDLGHMVLNEWMV